MPRPRIMVVRGAGWASRAIEGFGGGWPSHMAGLLADGSVWDARSDVVSYAGVRCPAGVQHRPAGYLEAENAQWEIYEAPAGSETQYGSWVATLASQVGKPYDKLAIIGFGVGLITGEYEDLNYASKDPSHNVAWYCDEYQVWAAGVNGLGPWPMPTKIFTLTPGAALMWFIGAGWKLVGKSTPTS